MGNSCGVLCRSTSDTETRQFNRSRSRKSSTTSQRRRAGSSYQGLADSETDTKTHYERIKEKLALELPQTGKEYDARFGLPKLNWICRPGDEVDYASELSETQFCTLSTKSKGKRLHLSYGYVTLPGKSSHQERKTNQDNLVVIPQLGGKDHLAVFGVFDGHGEHGEHASHFCRRHLEMAITHQEEFETEPAIAMEKAFPLLHDELMRSSKHNPEAMHHSGTTSVSVLFDGDCVYCANAGDSRAILCSYLEPSKMKEASPDHVIPFVGEQRNDWKSLAPRTSSYEAGQWVFTALSHDHTPHREDERARVDESGAMVLPESMLFNNGDPKTLYVCRVIDKAISHGCLFTRSIGDMDGHTNCGISSESEVRYTQLEEGIDKFLIIASDGVWAVLSNAEVTAISTFYSFEDAQKLSETILDKVKKRWKWSRSGRRDDITIIVIGLRWDDS